MLKRLLLLVMPLLISFIFIGCDRREEYSEARKSGEPGSVSAEKGLRIEILNKEFLEASNEDIVRLSELLDKGADINASGDQGTTRLWWAAFKSDVALVEFLVSRGADVNRADADGYTPLHVLGLERTQSPETEADLKIAEVLIAHGADVNAKCKVQLTPMDLAASNRMQPLVALLREHGGVPNCDPNRPVKVAHDLCDDKGD